MAAKKTQGWIGFSYTGNVGGKVPLYSTIPEALQVLNTDKFDTEYFLTIVEDNSVTTVKCGPILDEFCFRWTLELLDPEFRMSHGLDVHRLRSHWQDYHCHWLTERQYEEIHTRFSASICLSESGFLNRYDRSDFIALLHGQRLVRLRVITRMISKYGPTYLQARDNRYQTLFARIISQPFKLAPDFWTSKGIKIE